MKLTLDQRDEIDQLKECRPIVDVIFSRIIELFKKELMDCPEDSVQLLRAKVRLEAAIKVRHEFVATIK